MFSREGAVVVLAARSVRALEELAQELRAQSGRVLTVPTDVSHVDQLQRLVHVTLQVFGRIDVLVNNAGQGLALWAHERPLNKSRVCFASTRCRPSTWRGWCCRA
ncbi:MAG: SDR family NAD(P)-dependent oxidoreductase [Anaerolineae bacterium]|nr:MAG: SDR family NAD(P)-dependent oxidoreductase [Anaerolineae bacterium]